MRRRREWKRGSGEEELFSFTTQQSPHFVNMIRKRGYRHGPPIPSRIWALFSLDSLTLRGTQSSPSIPLRTYEEDKMHAPLRRLLGSGVSS